MSHEAVDRFEQQYRTAEWVLIPFFVGSNIVFVLSGMVETRWRRILPLLSRDRRPLGAAVVAGQAVRVGGQVGHRLPQRYQLPIIIGSIVIVMASNLLNFRRGRGRDLSYMPTSRRGPSSGPGAGDVLARQHHAGHEAGGRSCPGGSSASGRAAPRITSWWATMPRIRTEWTRMPRRARRRRGRRRRPRACVGSGAHSRRGRGHALGRRHRGARRGVDLARRGAAR